MLYIYKHNHLIMLHLYIKRTKYRFKVIHLLEENVGKNHLFSKLNIICKT